MPAVCPPLPVTGVILAGGRGTRLFGTDDGGDKALVDLHGQPLAAHIAERLRPQVRAVALNANGDGKRFARLGLPVIADTRDGGLGPLAGVVAAMQWSALHHPDATHVVTVPADTPFIPLTLVEMLMPSAASDNSRIVVAAHRGRHHHAVALWPVSLAERLSKALDEGVRAIATFTDRHETTAVTFPDTFIAGDGIDPFFNINTPADLAKARQLLAFVGEQ